MMEITTSSSMSVNARLDSAFVFLQFSILHLSCRQFKFVIFLLVNQNSKYLLL